MELWQSDEELFKLARTELFTAVVGDVMDKLGLRVQFLPPQVQPLRPEIDGKGGVSDDKINGFSGNLRKQFERVPFVQGIFTKRPEAPHHSDRTAARFSAQFKRMYIDLNGFFGNETLHCLEERLRFQGIALLAAPSITTFWERGLPASIARESASSRQSRYFFSALMISDSAGGVSFCV